MQNAGTHTCAWEHVHHSVLADFASALRIAKKSNKYNQELEVTNSMSSIGVSKERRTGPDGPTRPGPDKTRGQEERRIHDRQMLDGIP